MANPIDHLILVGFPEIDPDKRESTLRAIMDVANVERTHIHFYKAETPITDIIRKTFIRDGGEKTGYRIGNSVLLGSDAVSQEYRHVLKRLTKIGIQVRVGMNDVNLDTINEQELANWYETGQYVPIKQEEDKSDESLMESLLSPIDEEEPEKTESSTSEEEEYNKKAQEYQELLTGGKKVDYESAFPDQADVERPYDELIGSISEHSSGDSSGQTDEDYQAEKKPDETAHMEPEPEQELESEPDDGIDGEYDIFAGMSLADEEPTPEPEPEPERSSPGMPTSDTRTGTTQSQKNPRKETPKTRQSSKDDYLGDYVSPADEKRNDDMALVNDMERRRQREIQRKQELIRSLAEDDAKAENITRDDFGERSERMHQMASTGGEEDYRPDGTRKNYMDYLSDSDKRQQRVVESINKKFSSAIESGLEDKPLKDMNYVGEGKGRIILVSAGKGGVGKSMVADGMATALSLARAKDAAQGGRAVSSRVWLIESDYNSPQLAVAYGTGNKHLGNVADAISAEGGVNKSVIREAIEANAHVDPNTGVHILACPPLSTRRSSKEIPHAILLAIKYASDRNGDVIIDHGNLTSGEYSELDQVISMKMAHRVVLVCTMGCLSETQSALSLLCDRDPTSVVKPRPPQSVSVVLNSAKKEQYYIAQDMLKPFEIINVIPPIDAIRAENSMTGDTYLTSAPKTVRKAIIDRCGVMLPKLGYETARKYFTGKMTFKTERKRRTPLIRKIAQMIAGD